MVEVERSVNVKRQECSNVRNNRHETSVKQKKTPYQEICVQVLSYNPAVSTRENACGDFPKADKNVGKLESLLQLIHLFAAAKWKKYYRKLTLTSL